MCEYVTLTQTKIDFSLILRTNVMQTHQRATGILLPLNIFKQVTSYQVFKLQTNIAQKQTTVSMRALPVMKTD
jgi:hypothetical protein